jgi:hypothetical protein
MGVFYAQLFSDECLMSGHMPTNKVKRERVTRELLSNSRRSDRLIGKKLDVSWSFVRKVRKELIAARRLWPEPRAGRDGRVRMCRADTDSVDYGPFTLGQLRTMSHRMLHYWVWMSFPDPSWETLTDMLGATVAEWERYPVAECVMRVRQMASADPVASGMLFGGHPRN